MTTETSKMTYQVKNASDFPNNPATPGGGRPRKYPFNEMKVGQFFSIAADDPAGKYCGKIKGRRVAAAASHFGKRKGMKFSCIRQKDGSLRVERTA